MKIDPERPEDVAAIRTLTDAAFKTMAFSHQTEGKIIDALRDAGALTLSLVAVLDGQIVGHVAFSPVRINGRESQWYGLGPVSVRPDLQRRGIGSAIIENGLQRLRTMQAEGCVLLGDPNYYSRFGFVSDPLLSYAGTPEGYFQRLAFTSAEPAGEVTYHPGFEAV